jgi:dihydroflavonol-4-reductase
MRLAQAAVPELGRAKNASNEKAQRLLGWQPRSSAEAIVATAESLMQLGMIRIRR